jgi:TPR repeat protein
VKIRQLLIVGLCLLALAAPVRADDHAASVSSLRTRAAHGDASAQFNLGLMYYTGRGVPQDSVEAYLWFDLVAATAPHPDRRQLAVEARDYVAARMTPAQIAEAQKLARE